MKLTKRMRKLLAGILLTSVLLTGFSCQQQKIKSLEELLILKEEHLKVKEQKMNIA